MNSLLTRVLLVAMIIAAEPLFAGRQVQLLLDLDHNNSSGCTVVTAQGLFTGVESIVTASIEGRWAAVSRQECRDSVFNGPVTIPAFSQLSRLGDRNHLELLIKIGADAETIRLGILLDSAELLHEVLLSDDQSLPMAERHGFMLRVRAEFADHPRGDEVIRPMGLLSAPVPNPDFYPAVGNTLLEVGVTPSGAPAVRISESVLDNDTDAGGQPLTVSTFDAQSKLGGTVAMQPNGTFTYTPPRGVGGQIDTFTYTAADAAGMKSVGTVSLNIGTRVWYVRNTDASGGSGTSSSPYNRLGLAQLSSGPGDTIYVFAGDGTSRGQNVGIVLKEEQTLAGQGRQLRVDGSTLVPAGSPPVISNVAGPCVRISNRNIIEGLTITECTEDGITTDGSVIDTLMLRSTTISQTFADGLDIARATGTIVIGGSTIEKVTGDLVRIGAEPHLLVLVSNSTLQDTLPITGGDGIRLSGPSTGEMVLIVFTSNFTRLFGDAIDLGGGGRINDTARLSVHVSQSQFSSPFMDAQFRGINAVSVKAQERDQVDVDIKDNTFTGVGGAGAIMLQADDQSFLGGEVARNTISDAFAAGIDVEIDESSAGFLSIVENVVRRPATQGLAVSTFGAPDLMMDVRGNRVENAGRDAMSFSTFGGRLRLNLSTNEAISPGGSGYLVENAGGSAARFHLFGDPAKTAQQNVEQANTGTARAVGAIVVVPKHVRGARR